MATIKSPTRMPARSAGPCFSTYRISTALRARKYRDELFKDWAGKSLDDLWQEFRRTLDTSVR